MARRFFDLYQRKRVININANIIASGFLAILIAKYPVHLAGKAIGEDHKFLISLAAGAIDIVVDVLLYYALHWLANHWSPPWKKARPAEHRRSFFRDASLVQFERAIIAPFFYVIAVGLMFLLQEFLYWGHSWAFVVGFASGILITRAAHTLWGLKHGRFIDSPPLEDIERHEPAD